MPCWRQAGALLRSLGTKIVKWRAYWAIFWAFGGLEAALEGLSGPKTGKHSYLQARKRVRRPTCKSEVAAGRPQGDRKETARRPQGDRKEGAGAPEHARKENIPSQTAPGDKILHLSIYQRTIYKGTSSYLTHPGHKAR